MTKNVPVNVSIPVEMKARLYTFTHKKGDLQAIFIEALSDWFAKRDGVRAQLEQMASEVADMNMA